MRPVACFGLAGLSMLWIAPALAVAQDGEVYNAHWGITPEAEMAHPSVVTLTLPLIYDFRATACQLRYDLYRQGGAERPPLARGGKVIAELTILRGGEVVTLRGRKGRVKYLDPVEKRAVLSWWDPSGPLPEPPLPDEGTSVEDRQLPKELEPGDAVVATVQFRGLAPLEYSPTQGYVDFASLDLYCMSCATQDQPCHWQ